MLAKETKSILKNFSIILIPLLFVWTVDFLTKKWALGINSNLDYQYIQFRLTYNYGLMLGNFSELPHMVKSITLTTLGASILSSYFLAVTFIPMKSLSLRIGLSILTGGICGNVTDRFINGGVVDFIIFKVNNQFSPVFNIADLFQWVGYICILYGLYHDSKYYWPTNEMRNKFLINPRFQFRVGLSLGGFSLVTGFMILIFGVSFFQGSANHSNTKFFLAYGTALISFLSSIFGFIGIILSNRIAGPIFAVNRYINDTYNRKFFPLKLRENDQFKELELQLTKLNSEMNRLYEIEKNYLNQEASEEDLPPPLPADVIYLADRKKAA